MGGSRAPAGQVAPRTLFGSVLRPRDEGSARWTRAALIALGLHVTALVGVSLATSSPSGPLESAGSGGVALEVPVTFMMPRAAAAPSPAPGAQPASRPVPVRQRKSRPAPVLTRPLPAPVASPVAPSEPVEAEGEESSSEEAPEGVSESAVAEVASGGEGAVGEGGVIGGVAGGGLAGLGGLGLPSLPPPPPAPLAPEKRKALLGRYLQDLFRLRIAARFHYPAEAEELGLQGTVTVRVSLDGSGRLLGLRVLGGCPHPVLCDAALDTVRQSVPFPPPPAELGSSFDVDVPFQYRLE
ncbi:MAG TPA: energy transducer TonB [Myxococcaceae bacterium]|nr:energy transducer TonB [Myxococcaceae bacterium]